MSYPGTDRKFMVTAEVQDFFLQEHDFRITVKNRFGQVKYRLTKGDCFFDSDGRYYFTLQAVQRQALTAVFEAFVPDDDYDKQVAVVTDVQRLVPATPAPQRHKVHYQQVWTVSVDGDEYLADKDGKYILTADGKRIAFQNATNDKVSDMGKVRLKTMTGEQFVQLIEGTNPNGEIDTLPEMMQAAQGISDDETIQHDVQERIDAALEEEAATDGDIDEMFD